MTTQTKVLIAEGLLTWSRYERVSDRYGTVEIIVNKNPERYANFSDSPTGQHGKLVAEVINTRQSHHIGDFFNGWYPVTPEVGEEKFNMITFSIYL